MQDRFRRVPHLARLVWPFVLVVLFQGLISGASLYALSAVRAYVGGESLWSKGQKDAIYYLQRYGITHNPRDYRGYLDAIGIPLGDRVMRLSLDQPEPDLERARRGALQGGNHPADVDSLIWLYRNFHDVSQFQHAVKLWLIGDTYLDQLMAVAETLHARISSGRVEPAELQALSDRIEAINVAVTPVEQAFSETLGSISRQLMGLLLALNLLTGAALIALASWRTGKLLQRQQSFEHALEAMRERAQTTLAAIGDGVIALDLGGRVTFVNTAAAGLIGCHADAGVGGPLAGLLQIVDERTREEGLPVLGQILRGESDGCCESGKVIRRADGGSVAVTLVCTPIQARGRVVGAVLVLHDITRERQYMEKLSWQASHDALTGLTNRREFEFRLEQALQRSARQGDRHSLMYLDLDQFKLVNDTCGHAAGDELLRQLCAALEDGLREVDTLARLGGDEFGILLENCPPEVAGQIAEHLRQTVQGLHFIWNGRSFKITASIGMVHVSTRLESVEEALRCADMACYMAKEKGRNRVQLFSADDSELAQRFGQMTWVQRIRLAMEEDRFCLYAQPIYPLRPCGDEGEHVELLLRLHDEGGQLVSPGHFIPAAERFGLMPQVDRWVVRRAFEELAARARDGERRPISTCALNLSGATIGDPTFIDFLRELQPRYGVAPQRICFEITETSAIADLDSAARFVGELKALGYRFALDDFCAGMSSFAYLKHLPVDYLKIDGSFVKDILDDPIDRAMVEMINQIGHVMGKSTVAEFVESTEILEALQEIGVDYVQGYALAAPQPFGRRVRQAEAVEEVGAICS